MSLFHLSTDLWLTISVIGFFVCLGIAYLLRVATRGRARFDRVDKQGGSALLAKGFMEMYYWGMQPLARALVVIHVSPNMISWASLCFGFLSGAVIAFGHFGFAAIFHLISSFLDSLDGIVARETGVASDAGEVLDAVVDRYVEFFFLAGLVVYYSPIPALQVLALLALAGAFMVSYSSAKAEALQLSPPKGSMRRPERALYMIAGAALSPLTIPFLEVERDYGIAIGHPMVIALLIITVFSHLSAIERFYSLSKMIRKNEIENERLQAQAAKKKQAPPQVTSESNSTSTETLHESINDAIRH